MPYSDMWQDCQITLQHTRPCYAKSSYRSVDPQTLHGNVHQVDHVSNGPTNSAVTTTMFPLRLCGDKLNWSRSLESDATVRADYALTTPTTGVSLGYPSDLAGPTDTQDRARKPSLSPPELDHYPPTTQASTSALSGSGAPGSGGVGTPAGEGPSPAAQQLHSLQPHATARDLTHYTIKVH